MKRNLLLNRVGGATLALLAIGATACSSENTDAPDVPDFQTAISLDLSIPGQRATENGSKVENTIQTGKLNIYFTDQNNNIIHTFAAAPFSSTAADNSKYSVKIPIRPSEYAAIVAGKQVRVLAVANTDMSTISGLDQTLNYPAILSYGTEGQSVPMTNAELSGVMNYSGKSATDVANLFTSNNFTLNLSTQGAGTISLQRAVARIDFKKDNSVLPLGNSGKYGKVASLLPVNVHQQSYLFAHTSGGDANAASGAVSAFGNGSWIADFDWTSKTAAAANPGYLTSGFTNPTGATGDLSGYTFTKVSDLPTAATSGYSPWVYVAENTLPAVAAMVEGLSTGVVFRVEVCDAAGNATGETLDYYYWIRHNNNNNPHVMGQMEFSVVRNTIYQLSVKSFTSGTPREYVPTDPDEAPLQDITVDLKVTPWDYYRIDSDI